MELTTYLGEMYPKAYGGFGYSSYNGYDYDRSHYTCPQYDTLKAISEKYPGATTEPHTRTVEVGDQTYSITEDGTIIQKKVMTFVYNIDGLGQNP